MKRIHLAVLGIIGAAVLMAGCQMNVITKVERSGAGTLTTEVGMTPDEVTQLQSLGGETGGDACASLSTGGEGTAEAPAFEEEKRGEDTWCVAVSSFEDIDELARLYEEMGFVKIRELALAQGELVYDLEIDTQGSEGATMPGNLTWVLELPGKVGGQNADTVEGKRLTWTLESGKVTEVQASSDLLAPTLPFDLGGSEAWIIAGVSCVCCGGVLLLVAVVVVLLLRRKGRESGNSKPSAISS
jgi:hypothetical protein